MSEPTPRWALITGGSIVGMAVIAGFSFGYVHNQIYIPSDVHATATLLEHHTDLLWAGIGGWLLIAGLDVAASIGLYIIYRETQVQAAVTSAILRLVYTGILLFAVIELMKLPISEQWDQGVIQFASFQTIWSLGLIVFGFHLLTVAWLSWRSSFSPTLVSVLLLMAGLSYLIVESANSFSDNSTLISSSLRTVFSVFMAIGELGFGLWLIFRFARKSKTETRDSQR